MILFPALVFLSGFFITLAIRYLDQSVVNYYDFVALVMVFGGTVSVGIVLLPWEYRKDLRTAFAYLFRPERRQYRMVMKDILAASQNGQWTTTQKNYLYQRILAEGCELIQLGFDHDKLESILSERVFHSVKRLKKVGSSIRNLAKYPPAFGLMGTVFGLVNIMKHLEGATDASKLGVEMAVALIATMYGLVVANFLINPIGEIITKKAEEEEEYANIALEAVLMLKKNTPLLETIEMLNSFIPEEQRQGLETDPGASGDVAA